MARSKLPDVKANKKLAYEVFQTLLARLEGGQYPYKRSLLPQQEIDLNSVLDLGSAEEANFYFILCYYMRGWNDSNVAARKLISLYEIEPSLFVPGSEVSLDPESVQPFLGKYGLKTDSVNISRIWAYNSAKLAEECAGSPLNLFTGIEGKSDQDIWDVVCERLLNTGKTGFKGFRHKMISLFLHFLMDAGLIPRFKFPAPIDIHIRRLCVGVGIVPPESAGDGSEKYVEKIDETLRNLTFRYCLESADSVDLSSALWIYGKYVCGTSPQNSTTRISEKGEDLVLIPNPVDWSNRSHIARWKGSCGSCVFESHCKYYVRTRFHYLGRIFRVEPRVVWEEQGTLELDFGEDADGGEL